MEKHGDVDLRDFLAEHGGEEEKVVVVHPDDVAGLVEGDYFVGVGFVEFDVVFPPFFLSAAVGGLGLEVVEDWPDCYHVSLPST